MMNLLYQLPVLATGNQLLCLNPIYPAEMPVLHTSDNLNNPQWLLAHTAQHRAAASHHSTFLVQQNIQPFCNRLRGIK